MALKNLTSETHLVSLLDEQSHVPQVPLLFSLKVLRVGLLEPAHLKAVALTVVRDRRHHELALGRHLCEGLRVLLTHLAGPPFAFVVLGLFEVGS